MQFNKTDRIRSQLMKRVPIKLILASSLLLLGSSAMAENATRTPPDNTGVNVRDRAPEAMTAGQQSNAGSDVELISAIRRAVVKDDSLSMAAHNVKIVSENGKVMLRGPVNTEAEKNAIASKAQAIAGAGNVDNELEVKGNY
jgi:hyperosmotically inducible protein